MMTKMRDLYWYISTAKLQTLMAGPIRPSGWSIKLKIPWFESEGTIGWESNAIRKCNKFRGELEKLGEKIPQYNQISANSNVPLFAFKGEAHRLIDDETYWIAMHKDDFALLLVGASKHVLGASTEAEGFMSPSLDPVHAACRAVEGQESDASTEKSLTFAWQETIKQSGTNSAKLADVEGVAVFAGLFKPNKAQLRRVGLQNIANLVIASPIYVIQT